eukprot:10760320-Karenia_brevis.AAC.1
MDGWTYEDWQLLPPEAFNIPAVILNAVEGGAAWPMQTLPTKSHPLNKDPSAPFHPLSYRFLLLTSILYRTWGKLRLQHLQPWIHTWKTPHMFGGVAGIGAEDA